MPFWWLDCLESLLVHFFPGFKMTNSAQTRARINFAPDLYNKVVETIGSTFRVSPILTTDIVFDEETGRIDVTDTLDSGLVEAEKVDGENRYTAYKSVDSSVEFPQIWRSPGQENLDEFSVYLSSEVPQVVVSDALEVTSFYSYFEPVNDLFVINGGLADGGTGEGSDLILANADRVELDLDLDSVNPRIYLNKGARAELYARYNLEYASQSQDFVVYGFNADDSIDLSGIEDNKGFSVVQNGSDVVIRWDAGNFYDSNVPADFVSKITLKEAQLSTIQDTFSVLPEGTVIPALPTDQASPDPDVPMNSGADTETGDEDPDPSSSTDQASPDQDVPMNSGSDMTTGDETSDPPELSPTQGSDPADSMQSSTAPELVSATVDGDQVKLQFADEIADTIPNRDKFKFTLGAESRRKYDVKDIEVVGSSGVVNLMLNRDVDPDRAMQMDYFDLSSDQSRGVIESLDGVDLGPLNDVAVENVTEGTESLMIDSADFEGSQVNLFFDGEISRTVPSARRFKIVAGKKKQKINSIEMDPDSGSATINLKKPVDLYDEITLSYKDLRGDQDSGVVQDKSGNDLITTKGYKIFNANSNDTPPELLSAELDDGLMTLEFDSIINNSKLSKKRFKVKANGKSMRVASAEVDGDDGSFVNLVVSSKRNGVIDPESDVRISYRDPKGDQGNKVVEDIFGNDLQTFSRFVVDVI